MSFSVQNLLTLIQKTQEANHKIITTYITANFHTKSVHFFGVLTERVPIIYLVIALIFSLHSVDLLYDENQRS